MGAVDVEAIRESIREQTGRWLSLPSFVGGMGRVVDMFGTLNVYRYYSGPNLADIDAMRRDFFAVGRDIWIAIEAEKQAQG